VAKGIRRAAGRARLAIYGVELGELFEALGL
jgi:hypothetical protein